MGLMIQLYGWLTVNTISTIKVFLLPNEITKISLLRSCNCGSSNCTWIRQIRQGGLVKPTLKMIDFNRIIQISEQYKLFDSTYYNLQCKIGRVVYGNMKEKKYSIVVEQMICLGKKNFKKKYNSGKKFGYKWSQISILAH